MQPAGFETAREFVGFDNFIDIWKSTEMWELLGRTLTFMILTVGGATLLGMVLGFLFWGSGRMPGRWCKP